ncbi:MAG TPA: hypothetical protein VGF48_07295 [Thermoanaerobaculia bacterium]|jgi:hypothetical protein
MNENTHNTVCHEVVVSRAAAGASREAIIAVSRELQQWVEQQPGFLRRTLLEAPDGVWIDHVEWASAAEAHDAAARFGESGCAEKLQPLLDFGSMQMYHASGVAL